MGLVAILPTGRSLKPSAVSSARQGAGTESVTEPLNLENCFCSDSALSASALTQIGPYTGFGVRYLCKEKLWLIFTQSLTARHCLLLTVYTWACLFAGRNRRQTVKSSLLCNLPPHFCLTTSIPVRTQTGRTGRRQWRHQSKVATNFIWELSFFWG